MGSAEKLDLLLQRFLSGFFAIPARQPASGAITFAQMRVLWTLANNGRTATPGEISERLGVTSSTTTGLVERLADGGYIRRSHSDEDRRQVLLQLLPKGRRMMEGFRKLRHSRLKKLMTRLGRTDLDRMTDALETLNDILGRWKATKR
jgi:DNA-binding MarR family transcriptional regulator